MPDNEHNELPKGENEELTEEENHDLPKEEISDLPKEENNDVSTVGNNDFSLDGSNAEFNYQPQGENPYQQPPVVTSAASLAAQHSLDKVVKQIRDASGVAMFIATINIGLGALFTLISADFIGDIFEDTFVEPTVGFAYIIFGLIFLALSLGIFFRSRLCALAALVAFGVDAFLLVTGEGLDAVNIGGYVMRGALLVALLMGTFACLRYHSMRRKFAYSDDDNLAAAVKDSKAKMGGGRIFLYIVIGLVGIASLVYAASTGIFDTGRGFNNWQEHQFINITMRVPSEDIQVDTERVDGFEIVIGSSEARAVIAEFIAYVGILDAAGEFDITHEDLFDLGVYFLDNMMRAVRVRGRSSSQGTMAGGMPYYEITGYREDNPVAFRVFVVNEDIYVVGLLVASERDTDLFPLFFDSIERN